MAAVVGFLVVATIAIVLALIAAGPRHAGRRDPTFEIDAVAGRQVGVLSSLAGFAVTGLVFLVTQAHNVPAASAQSFTTAIVMFVVAYMGYFSSSLLFASVSHRSDEASFDLAAAQHAGASITLFSVFIGWLALRPLFLAFQLTAIAELAGWLLLGAIVVGYGFLATALYRTGYATARLVVLIAVLAVLGTAAYAVVVNVVAPGLRSDDAAIRLTVASFVLGVPAFLAMTVLPIVAHRERLVPVLAARWHLVVVGYAQAVTVLIGFLLLAVLGMA